MTKIGFAMPAQSIEDVVSAAENVTQYDFDSFSVYGDLGDLPPYSALHAAASILVNSSISNIGPMCVPVGLAHPELIASHAAALDSQLASRTSIGITRGAFLEKINEGPASLAEIKATAQYIQTHLSKSGLEVPLYVGGFGPRLLEIAGQLNVAGVKLGGTANVEMAKYARERINNDHVDIVLGAVSVLDTDRKAARKLARIEVAKYLAVVGKFDTTLCEDESDSFLQFNHRYITGDPQAHDAISDGLLDKFSVAGTPDDFLQFMQNLDGLVDRFEFGTPHGIHTRPEAIQLLGTSVLKELGL